LRKLRATQRKVNAQAAQLLNVVALANELPAEGLVRGQVGTVVEIHPDGCFEVEFSDDGGRTYALLPLPEEQLIDLHHAPVKRS